MPAVDGFVVVLTRLADSVAANWQPTVDDVDAGFLHDMRVAVRRTRSILSQAKRVFPEDIRDHFLAEFKWLGGVTTPARDLDVFVLKWNRYTAGAVSVEALDPVLRELEDRRATAHATLSQTLGDERAIEALRAWQRWLANPIPPSGKAAQRPLGQVVTERIAAAQKQVLTRGRSITAEAPSESLHELRKDAKKLRYLLECFGEVLASEPRKAFLKRLKALQNTLGTHQDAEVHITHLRELAQQLGATGSPAMLLAMDRVVHRLEERRQTSRDEFEERFRDYDSKPTRIALRRVMNVDV